VGLALLLLPWALLVGAALLTDLPPELEHRLPTASSRGRALGVRVFDRDRHLLREVRADDDERADRRPLSELGPLLPKAVIAAEDRRFYAHTGVDPWAMARALGSSILARRVVSGASTITQQLARNVLGAKRSLRTKVQVMALALRIEASLTKDEILEEYLNRVEFGPALRGAETAARYYFDKPAKELSLAEAATLAGIPRGPTLYDPRRGTARVKKRRDRVLDRMQAAGLASAADVERAKNEPITLAPRFSTGGAPHFVRAVVAGAVDPCAAASPLPADVVEVETTIERELQRETTELARATVREHAQERVTAASVVVLDNATGDVLAWVGSPDVTDAVHLGQNDGVRAERQPGSSLKPFLYELGMERLGMSPATMLPDVELTFAGADGDYRPRNYDERFHGPVLLREALGNSFNVPAVWTAERVGLAPFVGRLRDLGFCSLTDAPSHYGLGLALGDAEVALLSLANAYATLARGGDFLPVRAVRATRAWDGTARVFDPPPPKRVLDERATWLVTDVLSDRTARLASFGEGSVLELPFAVAAKTGTSKGYRDNITVGYTPEVTVAVWVGNFDGSPMKGITGITGAGPLFRSTMLAAAKTHPPTAFVMPRGIEAQIVCPLSGKLRGRDCPEGKSEHVLSGVVDRVGGSGPCDLHVRVEVERESGLPAGPGCDRALVEPRIFEWLPSLYADWARSAGRPLLPTTSSPRCPGAKLPHRAGDVSVAFPEDGARFFLDEHAASPSAIRIRGRVPVGAREVTLRIDGVPRPYPAGGLTWPLVRGSHSVEVVADGVTSEPVHFDVE
jgi:penicillin-binding protein 1C